jgi:hypothetical protein
LYFTVREIAADVFGVGLEDRDGGVVFGQEVCGGQPGRAGADHGDRLRVHASLGVRGDERSPVRGRDAEL